MSKPVAVAISDIHFNLNNLELASEALLTALQKADDLKVPLVIAGDLQDTKDIIRGKVANRIIDILKSSTVQPYIITGNHDLLNEKSSDHALNYLRPYATIVDKPFAHVDLHLYTQFTMLPYYNDVENLRKALLSNREGTLLFCHQGIKGAFMGDYIQDKTSIDPEELKSFRVISGHYHRHQTIGTVTYIGSPFTHTFGEANDGEKGYLVVNKDGTFTREIINLRKHIKLECNVNDVITTKINNLRPDDLVWVKLAGYASELAQIDKKKLGEALLGHSNFRLEMLPILDTKGSETVGSTCTEEEMFDTLIETTSETNEQKELLKQLWRELL